MNQKVQFENESSKEFSSSETSVPSGSDEMTVKPLAKPRSKEIKSLLPPGPSSKLPEMEPVPVDLSFFSYFFI